MNDVFFAVWEHIDSYDSARNPFANWIGGIARLKALDYKRKYANHLLETSWENAQYTKGLDDAIELHTQFEEEFSEETKQRLEKYDKEHRIYEAQIAKLQLTTQYLEEKGKKLA